MHSEKLQKLPYILSQNNDRFCSIHSMSWRCHSAM